MVWTLRFGSDGLQFHHDKASARRRALPSQEAAHLADWAERYGRAVNARNNGELLKIGKEIFGWLETDGHGWGALLIAGTGEISLDIVVDENPSVEDRAFLNVPWELVATTSGYLAEDALRAYCVQRRLGEARAPTPPRFQDLAVMFMAAAPRDVDPVLDFEAEEAGILDATAGLPLALTVEESGCPTFLQNRLADEGPFDIVHLTCHGAIGENGPLLALEEETGDLADTSAAMLSDALGKDKPSLTFLSACRTAENVDHAAPLAVSLLQAGAPAVLGWDGSVHDDDASHFARELYAELANHDRPALAVAKARQRLLAAHRGDAKKGQHWHLARLYVAPEGGGRLCEQNAEARPKHRGLAYNTFLDKERQRVPVAGASAFVGRRRALQDVFRAFRANTPGVLIHGFGGYGKSSLAARVADRCPRHKTALVFEFYDAGKVFDAALKAVPDGERQVLHDTWSAVIANDHSTLREALKTILTGPCAAYELNSSRIVRQPLLLVIDDLERILETPTAGDDARAAVDAEHKPVLGAVLEAFAETAGVTQSRLILTSRYDFALRGVSGADLAGLLARVSLRPFDDLEQQKQQSAAARHEAATGREDEAEQREDRLARCRSAAHGNPLVQAMLTRTALAEPAAAEAALAAMEAYFAGGANPDQGELADVFRRLAFDVYRGALTKDEAETFRALTLFEAPVPESACHAAAALLAHEAAGAAMARLVSLGLIDRFEAYRRGGEAEALANELARRHFAALDQDEQRTLAKAALPPLLAAWTNANGDLPADPRSLEVFRIAVLAGDATAQGKAARWGGRWLYDTQHEARGALAIVLTARAALAQAQLSPDPEMLRLGIECAERLGEAALQDELLAEAESLEDVDVGIRAILSLHQAGRLMTTGALVKAENLLRRAEAIFRTLQDDRSRAVAMGQIADILFWRGELGKALRIHQEELLPVFDRLGDVRARAAIMSKIADILVRRGELDEALRILQEELLPAFERLGDVRSRVVTEGQIADILEVRGDYDGVLRIRKEQLPTLDNLGDVRLRAVTVGQIADILMKRGEFGEALHILKEEELPVYDRVGDLRLRAVAMSRIADILCVQGKFNEALRIRTEEELPVYDQTGNVHERAVTMGKIADIHFQRGELDEALRIRKEEQLPVYERLGEVSERAVTMGQIADIFQARGELDEALRILREELLPVFERLGDVRSRAIAVGKIADILQTRGEFDEALRNRREEELPVHERLGDVRSRAVTIGKIADIHFQRGELDEALRIRNEQLPIYEHLGDVRSRAVTMGRIANILIKRGEFNEALRICQEEQLPAYERLGDVRERAVTMGQIAEIFQARGELDEALCIFEQECLAIFEKLGDVASTCEVLIKASRIRMQKGIDSQEAFDRVLCDLSHAYDFAKKLTRLDAICAAAQDLGDLLAGAGAVEEARPLIAEARDGYVKLELVQHAAQMDAWLAQLDGPGSDTSGGQQNG